MRTRRRQKRHLDYNRIVIAVVVLLVLAVAGAFGWLNMKDDPTGRPELNSGVEVPENIMRIMVMGVDKREDDVGRSDTLMVLTIDKKSEKASLLSIPRDTRVQIKGHDFDKINHAYAYGDAALTQNTVENLMGVPMDYYIKIDVRAFERIIDALDGVDLDVEKRMYYEDPWDDNGGLVIDLYPGMQHLDGDKAIQYVRYRDGEGDIGRINRQQHFMRAVLVKLLTPDVLPRLPAVIDEIRSAVDTDMPVDEMLRVGRMLPAFREKGLNSEMLPGVPAYLDDVSYWMPNILAIREIVAGHELKGKALDAAEEMKQIYAKSLPSGIIVVEDTGELIANKDSSADKPKASKAADEKDGSKSEAAKKAATKADSTADISVLVVNDSGINGAGARVADILRTKGFTVTGVETGNRSDRENTIIVTDSSNTNWFYGMPFQCTIMDGGEPRQAVVYIGLDYGE